ncbi:hypothetical protein GOP47_0022256 [Adiantum capillus-veneris]|uniref:Uncharacterized protein n=1 Tax=Adiantum capillus-veneris TaxID=13818 RepID=A0A9D4U900_ADICA|nr:hypothetical protein GOP47_0022256 [Adiantum capillus-veneris]
MRHMMLCMLIRWSKRNRFAGEETFCAEQGVGQPSLLPCDGNAILTEEECFDEVDWGFDDPMVDVDEELQVLVAKAMARIQGMQGFPPFLVLFEETTQVKVCRCLLWRISYRRWMPCC